MKGGTVSTVPPFIALTGGIGAGKSTALAALERLGVATISSDAVVHELYGTAAIRESVVARFGAEVVNDDVIDRGRLAAAVFASEAGRVWLEQLLWPLVRARVAQWREQMSRADPAPRALVVEVPLLFESGGESGYDATIAVVADEQARERRARERGHSSVAEREARQLSQEEKAQRADYVVVNDGEIADLEYKLAGVIDTVLKCW
jgi:dephospho-CoA kinase